MDEGSAVEHGIFREEASFLRPAAAAASSAAEDDSGRESAATLTCVLLHQPSNQLIALDAGCRASKWRGNALDSEELTHAARALTMASSREVPCTHLAHLPSVDVFLGWTPGAAQIHLLSADLRPISTQECSEPVLSLCAFGSTSDFVIAAARSFATWTVRRKAMMAQRFRVTLPVAAEETEGVLAALAQSSGLEEAPGPPEIASLVLERGSPELEDERRVFVVVGSSAHIYTLSGTLLHSMNNIHNRSITALMHLEERENALTGSKDGVLKLWDQDMQLTHVFVGHTSDITAIHRHPWEGLILTASLDETIRVWNLETLDIVYSVDAGSPVRSLVQLPSHLLFMTLGKSEAHIWRIQHLHAHFAKVGQYVSRIHRIESINTPARLAIQTKRNSLVFASPVSGRVITEIRLPPDQALEVSQMCFSSSLDTALILLSTGALQVWSRKGPFESYALSITHPPASDPLLVITMVRVFESSGTTTPAFVATAGGSLGILDIHNGQVSHLSAPLHSNKVSRNKMKKEEKKGGVGVIVKGK